MSRNPAEIDPKSPEVVALGDFTFDFQSRDLRDKSGAIIPLRAQSADVLATLATRPNEIVHKDTLMAEVWPDTAVTNDSLVQCITDIRRALGDQDHALIQTLVKRGYRLVPSPPRAVPARRRTFLGIGAALVVLLAVMLAMFWPGNQTQPIPASGNDGKPTIAVLAFDDFSMGADKGYLSDAIAEGIITELARSEFFRVIARNSSFHYRDGNTPISKIRAELGVDYLLEGSQQKSKDRLKVTVQLIDAHSQEHLWAHTYDEQLDDLFRVQDDIIRTAADRIGIRIERPLPVESGARVSALHHYLTGGVAIKSDFSEAGNAALKRHSDKAIAADPTAYYGYLGLAHYFRNAATFSWHDLDKEDALSKGFENARKALALAPDSAEVQYILARLYSETTNVDEALAHYEKAISSDPSASNMMVASTSPLLYIGRTDEAIVLLKRAMGIDPFHPDWYHWQMGWALWEKNDCAGALSAMQSMNRIPKGAHRMLAGIYACLGRIEDAQKAYAVFYEDAKEPTISEQRKAWEDIWTAPGSLDRWLDHMRLAGMKD